jgi:hypothetical protein
MTEIISAEIPNQQEAAPQLMTEVPNLGERERLSQRLANTRVGRLAVAALATTAFAEGASIVNTSEAKADAPVITSLTQYNAATVGESHFQESDFAGGKLTFGEYVKVNGVSKKQIRHSTCEQIGAGTNVPAYYNSLRGANGKIFFFRDGKRAKACYINGKWIKVSGSGPNHGNCGNEIQFMRPKKIVTGKVIAVRNFLKASVHFHSEAKAHAQASCTTPDRTASATAEGAGSGVADTDVRLKKVIKTRGATLIRLSGSVAAEAKASASSDAKAKCNENISSTTTTTPPSQPPPTPENRPPTGQGNVEHRFVSTTAPVCVEVSDPDGDAVNVTAFHFMNTNTGQTVGQVVGPIYRPDNTTNVFCENWTAPTEAQSVTWDADLNDARGARAVSTPDEFPVLANDTGPNTTLRRAIQEA